MVLKLYALKLVSACVCVYNIVVCMRSAYMSMFVICILVLDRFCPFFKQTTETEMQAEQQTANTAKEFLFL